MATQAKGAARIDRDRPVGLSVKLLLPFVAPPLEAKESEKALSVSTSVLGKTVLVVDDDPDVRSFFLNCLEGLGYGVLSAVNAEQGINILATAQPDVMIVDYAMPGMNGAQMAMVVRAKNPQIPIVFATGYSETAAIEEAVGHSAVWLKKPFGVYELESVLETLLKE